MPQEDHIQVPRASSYRRQLVLQLAQEHKPQERSGSERQELGRLQALQALQAYKRRHINAPAAHISHLTSCVSRLWLTTFQKVMTIWPYVDTGYCLSVVYCLPIDIARIPHIDRAHACGVCR